MSHDSRPLLPSSPSTRPSPSASPSASPSTLRSLPEPSLPDGVPLAVEELAARIAGLAGVAVVVADERSGAPESAWGDRFFFTGADRMMPFATLVGHDTPGWDEDSRLDRPGVYRLSIQLGRSQFRSCFGYLPARLADHRAAIDFGQLDQLLPHPQYGAQGWGCILSPTTGRLPLIDRLLAAARERSLRRDRRADQRRPS